MKKKSTLLFSTLIAASGVALAGDPIPAPAGNPAYAVSSGFITVDGSGDCVRTPQWKAELAIKECDPDLFPEPEPMAVEPEPEPAPAPPPPPPAPKKISKEVTLGAGALFAFNSSKLSPEGKAALDKLAGDIRQMDRIENVHIEGHTDSQGPEAYNLKLGRQRAEAVRDYLRDKLEAYMTSIGVLPEVITVSSRGENAPVASNDTPEGRAKNRRVEITIRGTESAMQ